ncbi:hypothetical protein B0H14DRAFT_2627655 [Mycena olivaceomarginata]|nr:hypothetical protein B0H14DRAFT_2627655 [Mycena olivaceomarginata]
MPALTLPFLPPGLSPAASLSLAILPWLLLLLALAGYLARHQILGGAKALLHALLGLDTGQPAGTKHPTRTRTRHFRTRRGSGPKPVRVYPRVVTYPRVFRPVRVTRC